MFRPGASLFQEDYFCSVWLTWLFGLSLVLAGWQPQLTLTMPTMPLQLLEISEGNLVEVSASRGELEGSTPASQLLPDSEVVYSPSAIDFDAQTYLEQAGGYLGSEREYLRSTSWTSAGEVVDRVALENSINPRLLLALLEFRCGCVSGPLAENVDPDYLLGVNDPLQRSLYRQLGWAANQLSLGYYARRDGLLGDFYLTDQSTVPLPKEWNAGSAAVAYLLARLSNGADWQQAMDARTGFPALYRRMFGDPWKRARMVEPLLPQGLSQPELTLPFEAGKVWSYTSGPHKAWETAGALAALDFAPASDAEGCLKSDAWIVAVADGVVARSEHGVVILDLDGDGLEQTGWAILYMHIESRDRVPLGALLQAGDRIGHPSCEGGPASGTHLHIARKYNGEWIAAGGPNPFVMDGWRAKAGYRPYEGSLVRDGKIIFANPYTPAAALITRPLKELLPSPKHSNADQMN